MYKIEYRSAVYRDLEELVTYLCNELQAHGAADRFLHALDKTAARIAEHPYMYKVYEPVLEIAEEYRVAPISGFVLFYTVNEQTKTASFCRVLYGRRDFDRLL